jgi:dTDP-4-amino-4,6-dideoxygalactose transaminase
MGGGHAVAFNNARTALLAILAGAGIEPGDGIALSPLTCEVVPLALLSAGFQPVYVDVQLGGVNLDPVALASEHRSGIRAVLFQHTYGLSEGVEEVARVAAERGMLLVEDCAHVMPMVRDASTPGRRGLAAIFSLNLLKPLPAGSGGMALTEDGNLAQAIWDYRTRLPARARVADALLGVEGLVQRLLLNPSTYWDALALNRRIRTGAPGSPLAEVFAERITAQATRISGDQARRGLRALAEMTRMAAWRQANCAWYAATLRDVPTISSPLGRVEEPLYYYPVLTDRKQELLRRARARRIQVVAWPNRTPIFGVDDPVFLARFGYGLGTCPVAEAVAARLVGLPVGPDVGPRHRRRVVELVREMAS